MSAPAIARLLRVLAVSVMDVHRHCRLYFAELEDNRTRR